jgi:two-component system sensor histidine kinase KdpD
MFAIAPWHGYACAVLATAACTLAGFAMRPRFDIVNIAMVYVLAVLLVAWRFPRGPTVLTSVLSVLAFDILFVPPEGVITVHDLQYLLTFAIMLAVGLVVAELRASVRRQVQAHAELELAAETERMRNALLASVSHDLRTPLAVMAGAASSLVEQGEQLHPDERRALAQSVVDSAQMMSEHVAKLLQMTRLESGAIRVERDWVALDEIVGSILRRLAERLAGHRVVVELAPDLPLIHVSAQLIEQALGNLLENAASHTPAGTIVRLRARLDGATVLVSVEDSGAGLDRADAERVFAKFQHGTKRAASDAIFGGDRRGTEGAADGRGGGIGLGLSICRAIVRLHGGDAWAERLQDGGSAFRFSLPLSAPPAVPAESGG